MRPLLSLPKELIFPSTDASRHMGGMVLMVISVLVVPGADTMAKFLTEWLHPIETAFWRFLVQGTLLAILVAALRQSFNPKMPLGPLVLSGALIAATLVGMVGAVSVMPIATTIAIFFVEPLVLTVFSVIFLGERAGWRRYLAIAVGLAGALIVIRPSFDSYGWYSLLPLSSAVCFAGYAVVLRRMPTEINGFLLQAWVSLTAAILLGLIFAGTTISGLASWSLPFAPIRAVYIMVGLGIFSTIVYLMFSEAFRRSEAGVLAPFQYLEIIGATILGYVFFGDFPDFWTWVGTAIILASGLYVFHRERRIKPASKAGTAL